HEDYAERGVRFIPDNWTRAEVFAYANDNLAKADAYLKDIKTRNIRLFCKIPLGLAKSTLNTMQKGHEKMTRDEVETLVEKIKEEEYEIFLEISIKIFLLFIIFWYNFKSDDCK